MIAPRRISRILAFTCIILLLGAPRLVAQNLVAQPAAEYAEVIEEARQLIRAHMDAHKLPGLGIAISVDGHLIWSEGFGYADLEHRIPITPLSRFRIGSISKPFTAAAVARLYDRGMIDLDTPVQTYVPSFPEKAHVVTTRQLGGHLGGIRHYRGNEFLSSVYFPTVLEGLDIFKDDPLLHPPGSKYAYSSYGWNLISAVVEAAAETEFLAYMDEEVFRPLHMTQTTADHNHIITPFRVQFYVEGADGQLQNAPYVDNSYKWAGGGFLSTTTDVLQFGEAHLGGSYLSPRAKEMLFTAQQTSDGQGTSYGFGWRVAPDDEGRMLLGHTGGSVGGTSVFMMQPETGVVLAAMVNKSSANMRVVYEVLDRFIDTAMEALPESKINN